MVDYEVDPLEPTNLALEGVHSTLKLYQDGEDLSKKSEQVLEKT
jgi:exonuclease VII small subunit